MDELRSLIFELRPPAAESEGLATALRKHVDVLQSVHGDAVALSVEGDGEPRAERAARSCASPRRRCRTRCATPAPAASTSACEPTTGI